MRIFYQLHPLTYKHLQKGHPWVTKDQFTSRFDTTQQFIYSKKDQSIFCFIHDPSHDFVKARLWQRLKSENQEIHFLSTLRLRLEKSVMRREQIKDLNRENIVLVFGESDQLPGLHITKLKDHIIIQFFCHFWRQYQEQIIQFFTDHCKIKAENIWLQERYNRGHQQKVAYPYVKQEAKNLIVEDNSLKFLIKLGRYYDFGLYTDMSAIRQQLNKLIMKSPKVLNLFAYTGAFTLMALAHGQKAESVDLSTDYLQWLEQNIELNNLNKNNHKAVCKDIFKYFKQQKNKFDLIICDPPSSFSDGKKKLSILDFYKRTFVEMTERLEPGGQLIVFCNRHSINREQFKKLILSLIPKNCDLKYQLAMDKDCSVLKNFPEGDYLKGLVIKKNL